MVDRICKFVQDRVQTGRRHNSQDRSLVHQHEVKHAHHPHDGHVHLVVREVQLDEFVVCLAEHDACFGHDVQLAEEEHLVARGDRDGTDADAQGHVPEGEHEVVPGDRRLLGQVQVDYLGILAVD